jgi:hypothetical protein
MVSLLDEDVLLKELNEFWNLCLQIYREIDDLFEDDVNDVVRE